LLLDEGLDHTAKTRRHGVAMSAIALTLGSRHAGRDDSWVAIRRMFSGYGISADGINFALALRGGLYFRADEQSIPRFEAEGSLPFSYQTRAKTVTVNSYWQLPARLFDDSEELVDWARAALAAAQRAALRKRPKKRSTVRKAKKVAKKKTVKKKSAKAVVKKRIPKRKI
jgi:DNA transformation protein